MTIAHESLGRKIILEALEKTAHALPDCYPMLSQRDEACTLYLAAKLMGEERCAGSFDVRRGENGKIYTMEEIAERGVFCSSPFRYNHNGLALGLSLLHLGEEETVQAILQRSEELYYISGLGFFGRGRPGDNFYDFIRSFVPNLSHPMSPAEFRRTIEYESKIDEKHSPLAKFRYEKREIAPTEAEVELQRRELLGYYGARPELSMYAAILYKLLRQEDAVTRHLTDLKGLAHNGEMLKTSYLGHVETERSKRSFLNTAEFIRTQQILDLQIDQKLACELVKKGSERIQDDVKSLKERFRKQAEYELGDSEKASSFEAQMFYSGDFEDSLATIFLADELEFGDTADEMRRTIERYAECFTNQLDEKHILKDLRMLLFYAERVVLAGLGLMGIKNTPMRNYLM